MGAGAAPADVYTPIHGAAIGKSGVCGCPRWSHPCAPFHLSLVKFLHQTLPRAAHPNPIPALPILLSLLVQVEPFSMTRLAAHRRGDLFPCKGQAGTPKSFLIPCKTPANPPRARTCRSRGRRDTGGGSPAALAPVSRCLSRHRGSGELYQEQDLGFWPGRTKPEFPFHSQSASHI